MIYYVIAVSLINYVTWQHFLKIKINYKCFIDLFIALKCIIYKLRPPVMKTTIFI